MFKMFILQIYMFLISVMIFSNLIFNIIYFLTILYIVSKHNWQSASLAEGTVNAYHNKPQLAVDVWSGGDRGNASHNKMRKNNAEWAIKLLVEDT